MASEPLPKYLAISREIESQLLEGRWGVGKIPSSREIAGAHKVSLVTASRALQVLRDKGLIRTVDRSGNYPTPAPAPSPRVRWSLYLRSTPGPWQQASVAATRAGFVAETRRRGDRLHEDAFEIRDGSTVADLREQARKAAEKGIAGVFFMPSRFGAEAARQDEAFLESCGAAGLAVILVERNLRGRWRPLERDLVATDDLDGGFRCTEHLIAQGCRRVAFVTGSPISSHEGRLAGYLAALQQAEAEGEPARRREPLVLEQQSGLPTKAAYVDLADRVLEQRADGVVCYQDYTAIGLVMELLTRGRRIPRDVAITGFDNLPIGNSFALGVTTYAFPGEAIARQAFRLMAWRLEEPTAPRVKVMVPGELIARESSLGEVADGAPRRPGPGAGEGKVRQPPSGGPPRQALR